MCATSGLKSGDSTSDWAKPCNFVVVETRSNRGSHPVSEISPPIHGGGCPMAGGRAKSTKFARRNSMFLRGQKLPKSSRGRQVRGLASGHSQSSRPVQSTPDNTVGATQEEHRRSSAQ